MATATLGVMVEQFTGGFQFKAKAKARSRTRPKLQLSYGGRTFEVGYGFWRGDDPMFRLADVESAERVEVVRHQDGGPRGCSCSCRPRRERTRCVHVRALEAVYLVD